MAEAVAVAGGQLPVEHREAPQPVLASAADALATPMPWRKAPVARQLGALIALAAAVAIGVGVALWSQSADYVPLFNDLSPEDQGKITELLQASQSDFRVDEKTGAVLVPAEKLNSLRMQMAQQGLPQSKSIGLEMLQESQDLSTSQFVESARYQHALETELARSIMTLRPVRAARVHLALPKRSIFVRKREQPSASVVVSLHPGRLLEREQVEAIVHMVASSIPNLTPGQVSVVDQMGRLLTDANRDAGLALSDKQFDHTRRLEQDYSERIVRLLEPVVGFGRVRAQVTAEVDFNSTERTSESFDPARQVVRSEQVNESESRSGEQAIGIPGALSNQPPGAGTTEGEAAAGGDDLAPTNQTRSATRNFEVDKTISHTRQAPGAIQRLAVAVIVDDKLVRAAPPAAPVADGDAPADAQAQEQAAAEETAVPAVAAVNREPYSEAELAQLTALVRESIGFNTARGDTVQVLNRSFLEPEIEALPELPIWEKPWFQSLVKQVLAGIFILLVLLLVVRPIIRGLIPADQEKDADDEDEAESSSGAEGGAPALDSEGNPIEGTITDSDVQWGADGRPVDPMADAARMEFDKKLEYARILVEEDAGRAANVLKLWMKEEAA